MLAERIFGEEGHLELTVVNFNTMPAKLRSGLLDCAVAIAQKDMSPSLSYSNAYYDDAVAIMVRADSAVTEPHQLAGLTVGCINRDGTNQRYTCRNVLNSFASGLSPAAKVVEYSAIPDMIADLADGTIDAVCLEYALLYSYYSPEGHRILSEAIGTISYAVALPSGRQRPAEIANELIAELRASGELQAMLSPLGPAGLQRLVRRDLSQRALFVILPKDEQGRLFLTLTRACFPTKPLLTPKGQSYVISTSSTSYFAPVMVTPCATLPMQNTENNPFLRSGRSILPFCTTTATHASSIKYPCAPWEAK